MNKGKDTKESRFHNAHPVLSGIIVTVIGGLILAGILALLPAISNHLTNTTTIEEPEEQSAAWGHKIGRCSPGTSLRISSPSIP